MSLPVELIDVVLVIDPSADVHQRFNDAAQRAIYPGIAEARHYVQTLSKEERRNDRHIY
jgi:hypothetical protein